MLWKREMIMVVENDDKKGSDLKEKVAFELSFFMKKLKETVVDAIGIKWFFEDGLSMVCSGISVMILWYVRWMIMMAIFVYGALIITAWLCPHSGAKFW
jgi:uncharacterized protein YsxB (DUF464 family)